MVFFASTSPRLVCISLVWVAYFHQILISNAFVQVARNARISRTQHGFDHNDKACNPRKLQHPAIQHPLVLAAGGFGGGGSASVATKSKKKNNNKTNKKVASSVNNNKNKSTQPFDANASLLRLEKKYEELNLADTKRLANEDDPWDQTTSIYVVAVRPSQKFLQTTTTPTGVSDWVPVAQLILTRNHDDSDHDMGNHLLRAAVSMYCRELAQAAVMGSRVFANVPRNNLEYSVEPTSSFDKHVYENLMEDGGSNSKNGAEHSMTNAQAAQVLGLDRTNGALVDQASLKRLYHQLSMECHPDQMIGKSTEEQEDAALKYTKVKRAYETLIASGTVSSSQTSSWYESLGGRERNEFRKIEELFSISQGQQLLDSHQAQSAVAGLDPELVQVFVARGCSRIRL